MLKSAPKKPVVPEAPQKLPNSWLTLWAVFEENVPYTMLCVISAVIAVILTVVFFMNRFKREKLGDAGDGDKKEDTEILQEKQADMEENKQGDNQVIDKEGEDIENVDTSEGQDGSEEDLPWILQKAPSENTLSDEKGNWTNDEKQSEGTDSEKSQDFVRLRKSAAGDLDGRARKELITNEEDKEDI